MYMHKPNVEILCHTAHAIKHTIIDKDKHTKTPARNIITPFTI